MKMKRSKNKSKSAFVRDDVIRTIQQNTTSPVVYLPEKELNEMLSDFIVDVILKNSGILSEERIKIFEKDVLTVTYLQDKSRYSIWNIKSKEYICIDNTSRNSLKTLERFVKEGLSVDKEKECSVCFDSLTSSGLTHSCDKCLNTICLSCFVKMIDKNIYTCCFCRDQLIITEYEIMVYTLFSKKLIKKNTK